MICITISAFSFAITPWNLQLPSNKTLHTPSSKNLSNTLLQLHTQLRHSLIQEIEPVIFAKLYFLIVGVHVRIFDVYRISKCIKPVLKRCWIIRLRVLPAAGQLKKPEHELPISCSSQSGRQSSSVATLSRGDALSSLNICWILGNTILFTSMGIGSCKIVEAKYLMLYSRTLIIIRTWTITNIKKTTSSSIFSFFASQLNRCRILRFL